MGGKFDIKAASSREVSDERTLAKLSLNFRKSSRSPILYGTLGGRAETSVFFTCHHKKNQAALGLRDGQTTTLVHCCPNMLESLLLATTPECAGAPSRGAISSVEYSLSSAHKMLNTKSMLTLSSDHVTIVNILRYSDRPVSWLFCFKVFVP